MAAKLFVKLDYHRLSAKQKFQLRRQFDRRKFSDYIIRRSKSYYVIDVYLFEYLQYEIENNKLYRQVELTLYQQLSQDELQKLRKKAAKHHRQVKSRLKILVRDAPCDYRSAKYNQLLRHIYY